MGKRLRTGWLLGAGAAVVLGLGSSGVYLLTSGDQHGSAAPPTARVQRGTVTATVAAAGTLQPAQTRGLAFSMDGTVTEVRVRPGDQVTAGQVLAKIDDTDAKARVSSAQDALDAAQEALDGAESTPTPSSTAGCLAAAAYVASPSATASPSPTPSRRAASPSPTSPASGGSSGGGPAGGGSPGDSPRGGQNGQECGANQQQGGGADRLLSAQQQVNKAREQLADAEQDLAGTTVTAPIAGRVLSVAGAVGSRATASSSGFIVLGDVADMQVKADFPEADASGLKVGQTATVSLADRPGEPLPAKVTQVEPTGTVDGQTSTSLPTPRPQKMVRFGVLLAFDKVPDDLLTGQSADVQVQTGSATGVLCVPASAVHDVTVKLTTGVEKQVEVGLRGDQYVEIKSGLAEGDEVVASW
jgi:multidrug efflux pump subunit AcrA (membrane-fusion protein)